MDKTYGQICRDIAQDMRDGLERWTAEHEDCDLMDFFTGSIYGETEDGGIIVGFGVYGSANVVVERDCVVCGGHRSEPFSEDVRRSLADFRDILENC